MNPLLSLVSESDMVDGRAVGKIFKKNTQLKIPLFLRIQELVTQAHDDRRRKRAKIPKISVDSLSFKSNESLRDTSIILSF